MIVHNYVFTSKLHMDRRALSSLIQCKIVLDGDMISVAYQYCFIRQHCHSTAQVKSLLSVSIRLFRIEVRHHSRDFRNDLLDS